MKNKLILVRYGEIGLKARYTRKRFEGTLINNIRNALKNKKITFNIKQKWGRIFVYTNQIDKSIIVLKKIFGIKSISPVVKTKADITSISKLAVKIVKENTNKNNSFALRVKRTGKHNFSSQDAAVKIGNDIVKETKLKVNLTNPDFELFIEIKEKNTYLFIEKIKCVGGLPLKTQGNVLVLIDTKFSILSAWFIMRRGCKPIFLLKEEENLNILLKFIENWYTDKDIIKLDNKKKLHDLINKTSKEKDIYALVTSHSLYQPSNNIISEINILNKNITIPVLHPLIAMTQKEIQKQSKEIGVV